MQKSNTADADWTRRMSRLRAALNLGQRGFAEKIGCGADQSDISRWESGAKQVPSNVKKVIERIEATVDENLLNAEEPVHTSEFCYTATTFRRIWTESKKRIRRNNAEAVIEPSATEGFADATVTIEFEGIELPEKEELYLDCFGVIPPLTKNDNLLSYDRRFGSELVWTGRLREGADDSAHLGLVEEVKSVQSLFGPFALGYRLSRIPKNERVKLAFKAIRGVRTGDIDGIGIPVYSDCPVEWLSLSVTFKNLLPTPSIPTAKYWLLRRALGESRPISLVDGLAVSSGKDEKTFSFNNLQYPRPGYGYCIAWGALKSPRTTKRTA